MFRVRHIPKLAEDNIRTGFLENTDYRKLRDLFPNTCASCSFLVTTPEPGSGSCGPSAGHGWARTALYCTREPPRTSKGDGFQYTVTWENGPPGLGRKPEVPVLPLSLPARWSAVRRLVRKEGVENGLFTGRIAGTALSRPEAIGRAEYGPRGDPSGRSDAHLGTQNRIHVQPVQHRVRTRPRGCQGEDGALLV